MSAQAEVAPPSTRPDGAGGALRVRPPRPLPPARRAAIGIVVALLVVVGSVLVVQARSEDGDAVPGAAWRTLPVPRAALVDGFEQAGPLGDVDGFGSWETGTSSFVVGTGILRSGEGGGVATVDAGSSDALVHAQVVHAVPGGGLLLSSTPDGASGLVLRVAGSDRWELVWTRSGPAPQVLGSYDEPTDGVSVQAYRRGDAVKVAFDDRAYDATVPEGAAAGTFVGVTASGPGNELELFGYLPLDPG